MIHRVSVNYLGAMPSLSTECKVHHPWPTPPSISQGQRSRDKRGARAPTADAPILRAVSCDSYILVSAGTHRSAHNDHKAACLHRTRIAESADKSLKACCK